MKLSSITVERLKSNPRASAAAWHRYCPFIVEAIKKFPQPSRFIFAGLSPTTAESRIRDAIRGKIAFGYTEGPAVEDVVAWWEQIIVKRDGDFIYLGLKDKFEEPLKATEEGFQFINLDAQAIEAFALLLSRGHLKGPVKISVPPTLVSLNLLSFPNLQVLNRPDGSLVLI